MSPRSNPKPLVIATIGLPEENPTLVKFQEKGHTIFDIESQECGEIMSIDEEGIDVFIGPRCWRIDPHIKLGDDASEEESLERQLEMMEKGVRAIKYPKEKKDAK